MPTVCTQCENAQKEDRKRCAHCAANGSVPWTTPESDAASRRRDGSTPPFIVSVVRADGRNAREMPGKFGEILLDYKAELIPAGSSSAEARACLRITASESEGIFLEEISGDGVFRRIRGDRMLILPWEVRFGNHRCLIEEIEDEGEMPGFWGAPMCGAKIRVTDIINGGVIGDTFLLNEGDCTVGREEGDIVFYPMDSFISGVHAKFIVRGNLVIISDQHSSNGTFVRIAGREPVANGDQFLLGPYLIKLLMK